MKKVLAFCVVLAAFATCFAQDTTDLMSGMGWLASKALGRFDSLTHPTTCSTYVDVSKLFADTPSITAFLKRGTRVDSSATAPWPWVQLAARGATPFTGAKSIKIVYSATDTVGVVFQQPGLALTGSSYLTSLPPSATIKTAIIPVASLHQPTWVTTPSKIALDSIYGPTFEINLADYSKVQTLTITIKDIAILIPSAVNGLQTERHVAFSPSLTIRRASPRSFQLAIPSAGSYSLALCLLNGKSIDVFSNRHFEAGYRTVALDSKPAPGTYILKLDGNGASANMELPVK